MQDTLLEMRGITKVYANGFVANKDVNFSVAEGEIHALVGENGAGKSTLMKVLFGIETPEEGKILLNNKEIKIDSPLTAIKYGIGMVHQHFMLVPSLTVAENMVLGMEPKKKGLFSFEEACRMTAEIAEKYQFQIDPKAKVEDIPVGTKQKVEILKALLRGAKILILDEPTAVLTPQETKELFVQLKNLRKMGHTVIFISHKLQEIKELCDRLTVLRLGKCMGTREVAGITEQEISRLMVGRDVILDINKDAPEIGKTILSVKDVRLKKMSSKYILNGVTFSVRAGEILGVAGVEGNGQRELSDLITGMEEEEEGEIWIDGVEIRNKSIREIRDLGVAHVSEDRMTYGAVADASVKENLISDRYQNKEFNKGLLFHHKKIAEMCDQLIKQYLIKCDDREQMVGMLSGGNIQKVVVAREFSSSPKLIIANQPTRGIDVGASEFIRNTLVKLRNEGVAVLLISADLNEILEVSDSIIVMNNGEITAYLPDNRKVTEDELGEYMLGVKRMTAEEIGRVAYE
ncbi:MAG: ABC transporter ATP-binding protein [Clostridiales bacterium]|nr:ABC transporter ATP-binding protein [Clostridiales bacterium]